MKNSNLPFLILTIVSAITMSCSKTPSTIPDGGESADKIYILIDDQLVKAHEYVLNVAGSEGFTDLDIVSYGLTNVEILGSNADFSIEEMFRLPEYGSVLFKKAESADYDQYKQVVRIKYKANPSGKVRSAVVRFHAEGFNGFLSDIIVKQGPQS